MTYRDEPDDKHPWKHKDVGSEMQQSRSLMAYPITYHSDVKHLEGLNSSNYPTFVMVELSEVEDKKLSAAYKPTSNEVGSAKYGAERWARIQKMREDQGL